MEKFVDLLARSASRRAGVSPRALLLDRLDEAQSLGERAVTYSPFRQGDEARPLHLLGDIVTIPTD